MKECSEAIARNRSGGTKVKTLRGEPRWHVPDLGKLETPANLQALHQQVAARWGVTAGQSFGPDPVTVPYDLLNGPDDAGCEISGLPLTPTWKPRPVNGGYEQSLFLYPQSSSSTVVIFAGESFAESGEFNWISVPSA